ncbi:MAG TPA: carbohydrate binding family 9 domain-containing protein [Acidobacteriaceae bacterium]|jgi:hypothetical protein|nr:carbohydrate binding family 9 domain-containing protein [Acidobacteriaceae bacterium]
MRLWSTGWLAVVFFLAPAASPAQTVRPGRQPPAPNPQRSSDATVPLIAQPLHLSDFEGMQPRADLRPRLAHLTDFIQQHPNDGSAPTERTEVWFARTTSALYFVFVCYDHNIRALRGHLARRENILNDDNVTVLLDPFQDRRKAILFSVNPYGVQADANYTENFGTDYSYDQVWDSEGRVTRDGWLALLAIPFRSIRSHRLSSNWGVVFQRTLPRNSEDDWWPRITQSISGILPQEGTLHGIEAPTGSHNVQLNPYGIAQNERTLFTLDPQNPYFSKRHLEATGGGDAKIVLKDTLVLDATISPDFSTVESDQPQFTVNQRYPVYFPELRPFFLENASYFSSPIQLLYTRNIVHPEFGARLTGKVGHTNIGLLTIDDRQPGYQFGQGDPLFHHRALFTVGRISQDIGKGSSVGVLYAGKEFGEGWNRVGGVDFTARMNAHWILLGQTVESSTRGDSDSPSYSAGPASYIELQRNGHSLSMDNWFQDISPGFRSQVGFVQTTNIRSDGFHSTYQWYPKHSFIQSYGLETGDQVAWDHQGNRIYHYLSFDPFVTLPRKLVLAPIIGQNSDTLGPQNGYGFTQNRNFTENYISFVARGSPFTQLTFNLQGSRGGNVNYNPRNGALPELMNQYSLNAQISLQPINQLTLDNTYLLDRDFTVHTHQFVYESQTFRTKANYQFTRSLSARAIIEYDTTLVNPAQTSLLRTKQIGTQLLLTWLPHPGTALYLGYNNDLANLDRRLCTRGITGMCDPNATPPRAPDYLNDGKQIFVKASYLFRF